MTNDANNRGDPTLTLARGLAMVARGKRCFIVGLAIYRHLPNSAVWVIGTLVGISLIFTGFSRLMLTLTAKRLLTA